MRGPGAGMLVGGKPYDEDRLREIRKEASRLKKEGLTEEANHMSLIADAYEAGTSMGKVNAALVGVADGLTMNYGDEIAAGTYALARMAFAGENLQKNYGETVNKLRRYQKEAELTEPGAKALGEVGGGILGALATPGAPLFKGAGTAGRTAIEAWKGAKGIDRAKKLVQAGHIFGKAAIPYGIISGTGRGEGVVDTVAEGIGGGAGAYAVGGVAGPFFGQFFRKGVEGEVGDYIGQKGKLLAKMRDTFGNEVDKHVDKIDELNDNLTKYGLKGMDLLKGSEKIAGLKNKKNADLGTFLDTWNSEMRKMGEIGEINADITSTSAKDLARGFHEMVNLDPAKRGTGSPFKSKPDFPKIQKLLWEVNDNLDDGSVKTITTAEAKARISDDPTETIAIDKLDKKIFNVAGLRRLLNIIDEKVNFNDPDQDLLKRFGAHIRAEYGDRLGVAKGRIESLHPEAKTKLKDILPDVENLPGEIHRLKKLEDLYKAGIDSAKKEAADQIDKPSFLGNILRFGTKSNVRKSAELADKILSRKKGEGILKVDLDPASALKPSGMGYKHTGLDRMSSLEGRLGDIGRDYVAPDIEPPKIDFQEQLKKKAEEDAINRKQLYNDQRNLNTIPQFQHGPGPMNDDERSEMPLPQTSIQKPKTDKLLAAIKRARDNGEIISTTDPDFKRKIRKYLVDSDLDYA